MIKRCAAAKSSGEGHTYQKLVLLPHDTFQRILAKSGETEASRMEALSQTKTLTKDQFTGQIAPVVDQQRENLALIRELETAKAAAAREREIEVTKAAAAARDRSARAARVPGRLPPPPPPREEFYDAVDVLPPIPPPPPPPPAAPQEAPPSPSTSSRGPRSSLHVQLGVPDPVLEHPLEREDVAVPERIPAATAPLPPRVKRVPSLTLEVPQQYKAKYSLLHDKIASSNEIFVDPTHRVIVFGNVIEGSNYWELVRSLFVKSNIGEAAVGRDAFLNALARIGVQSGDVSVRSAKDVLDAAAQQQQGTGLKHRRRHHYHHQPDYLKFRPVKHRHGSKFIMSKSNVPPGRAYSVLRVYV
jgi:hypothetical protein